MNHKILILILSILFLAACNSGAASGNQEAEYDSTKKMVVDILQTDEGKKTLQQVLAEEDMKKELVMNTEVVKDSIDSALTSDKAKEMWQTLFEDPKFVESYTKSVEDAQMEMIKKLMDDSKFQEKMLELLRDPKMDEQMLTVLKSQEFRSHLETTIQETLESPTFQAKMQDILIKAAEEQAKGGGKGGGSGNGGSGSSGGSGGGGNGGSGGGGEGGG